MATLCAETKAILKLDLGCNGGIRRIAFGKLWNPTNSRVSFGRLSEMVHEYSNLSDSKIYCVAVTYTDEEGDIVTLSTDNELTDAFEQFSTRIPPIVRATASFETKKGGENNAKGSKQAMSEIEETVKKGNNKANSDQTLCALQSFVKILNQSVDELSKNVEGTQLVQRELKKKCLGILKILQLHDHFWVFSAPVDPVKLMLPDYFSIVTKPMDLRTVQKKVDLGQYHSIEEFHADVCLTFDNAILYNEAGSVVHVMAIEVKTKFIEEYDRVVYKLKVDQMQGVLQSFVKILTHVVDKKSYCSKDSSKGARARKTCYSEIKGKGRTKYLTNDLLDEISSRMKPDAVGINANKSPSSPFVGEDIVAAAAPAAANRKPKESTVHARTRSSFSSIGEGGIADAIKARKGEEEANDEDVLPELEKGQEQKDKTSNVLPLEADLDKGFIHGNHTCDRCQVSPIIGFRYRALNLPDYDLCDKCMLTHGSRNGAIFKPTELERDRCLQNKWKYQSTKAHTTEGSNVPTSTSRGIYIHNHGFVQDFLPFRTSQFNTTTKTKLETPTTLPKVNFLAKLNPPTAVAPLMNQFRYPAKPIAKQQQEGEQEEKEEAKMSKDDILATFYTPILSTQQQQQQQQLLQQQHNETVDNNVAKIPQEESELPSGWLELLDPSSGYIYYFNEAENRATWDKPLAAWTLPSKKDQVESEGLSSCQKLLALKEGKADETLNFSTYSNEGTKMEDSMVADIKATEGIAEPEIFAQNENQFFCRELKGGEISSPRNPFEEEAHLAEAIRNSLSETQEHEKVEMHWNVPGVIEQSMHFPAFPDENMEEGSKVITPAVETTTTIKFNKNDQEVKNIFVRKNEDLVLFDNDDESGAQDMTLPNTEEAGIEEVSDITESETIGKAAKQAQFKLKQELVADISPSLPKTKNTNASSLYQDIKEGQVDVAILDAAINDVDADAAVLEVERIEQKMYDTSFEYQTQKERTILESVNTGNIKKETEESTQSHCSAGDSDEWTVVDEGRLISSDEMIAKAAQLLGSALFHSDIISDVTEIKDDLSLNNVGSVPTDVCAIVSSAVSSTVLSRWDTEL